MRWLLKVYPPAWQRRFRDEVEAHLAAGSPGLRTALDLIAGAVDAWMHPNWIPEATMTRNEQPVITASRCGSIEISRADAARGAIWMIGLCLGLTATGVVLNKALGPSIMAEALLYSAFFIAFTVASRYTYLKPYSRTARNVIIGLGVPGWFLFFLGATALSKAI